MLHPHETPSSETILYCLSYRKSSSLIIVDYPVYLPANVPWIALNTIHAYQYFPQFRWLWFGFLLPHLCQLGSEEWHRRKCHSGFVFPVFCIYVEDTHGILPRMQCRRWGGGQSHGMLCRDLVGADSDVIHMDRLLKCTISFLQRWIFVLLFICLEQYADFHFIYKT